MACWLSKSLAELRGPEPGELTPKLLFLHSVLLNSVCRAHLLSGRCDTCGYWRWFCRISCELIVGGEKICMCSPCSALVLKVIYLLYATSKIPSDVLRWEVIWINSTWTVKFRVNCKPRMENKSFRRPIKYVGLTQDLSGHLVGADVLMMDLGHVHN